MRSGFVAVAGRPNVGKSTLVNAICGTKVAIVSDKPQTTRRRIRGIYTTADAQLVLTDIPGFQKPLDPMTERMQATVDSAFEDVDAVNKVDRLKPGHIASQMQTAAELGEFHALHPVSAKTGDGVAELRQELIELLPEGPLY